MTGNTASQALLMSKIFHIIVTCESDAQSADVSLGEVVANCYLSRYSHNDPMVSGTLFCEKVKSTYIRQHLGI